MLARRWAVLIGGFAAFAIGVAFWIGGGGNGKQHPIPAGGVDRDLYADAPASFGPLLAGMPPILDRRNIYSADAPMDLSPAVRGDIPMVYVPNSVSNTVSEIDPANDRVVRTFPVATEPQHVVPSWDLKTLWVTSDLGNALTPIDPRTGIPGKPLSIRDPYNLYFTPNGRFAIVVAERFESLDFRNPHTMKLKHALKVPCPGVDHMDFSANGQYLVASCEFGSKLIKV
ncbi:MAG: YncE family protein, partial [Acidimicrobiales bacterium]